MLLRDKLMKKFVLTVALILGSVGSAAAQQTYPSWIQYIPPATFSGGVITGQTQFNGGTEALPNPAIGDSDSGFYNAGSDRICGVSTANARWCFIGNSFIFSSAVSFAWGSTTDPESASGDTILARDAANILALKNGTNAQEFRIYETDAANDNYLRIFSNGSTYQIISGTSGGSHRTMVIGPQGNSGVLQFQTQAIGRWTVDANGHFVGVVDNTYDIGASGATRPRSIYASTSILSQGGGFTCGASGTACTISLPATAATNLFDSALAASGGTDVGYQFDIDGNIGGSPDIHTKWTDNNGGTNLMRLFGDGALAMTGALTSDAAVTGTRHDTTTNCSSSAAPAVCSSASAGSVVIAAAGTTVTVNTTAVTANSQIFIQEDSSLGTKLSVTCNTTTTRDYYVTARTAATSFQITASAAPVTNPACLSYFIVN